MASHNELFCSMHVIVFVYGTLLSKKRSVNNKTKKIYYLLNIHRCG